MKPFDAFLKLSELFIRNGYNLFLVGGSVRNYLFSLPLDDMDVTSDATPNEMKKFLTNADFTFEKMGSIKLKFEDIKFDITTLREESSYLDNRHPAKIIFVKDIEKDYKRRDFTINALYMDKNLKIYDFVDGKKDIENKILRMVGNPDERLKEDPLRIIRAIRFSLDFDLEIEKTLEDSLIKNVNLLEKLNKEKIILEIKKIKTKDLVKKREKFLKYHINDF